MGMMGGGGDRLGRMGRPAVDTGAAVDAGRVARTDELDACIAAVAALADPEGKLPPLQTVLAALERRRPPGPRGALRAHPPR